MWSITSFLPFSDYIRNISGHEQTAHSPLLHDHDTRPENHLIDLILGVHIGFCPKRDLFPVIADERVEFRVDEPLSNSIGAAESGGDLEVTVVGSGLDISDDLL